MSNLQTVVAQILEGFISRCPDRLLRVSMLPSAVWHASRARHAVRWTEPRKRSAYRGSQRHRRDR